jgi:hypothetical protein
MANKGGEKDNVIDIDRDIYEELSLMAERTGRR